MLAVYFLKAEEGMEIEDRVAFACKYLPDSKVCELLFAFRVNYNLLNVPLQ